MDVVAPVSSRKTKAVELRWRCQIRQRRRRAMTSDLPCSLALSVFFVPEVEAAQRRPDRGQRAHHDALLGQGGPQLRQGDARLGRRQLPQQIRMTVEQGPAVAAELRRGDAARGSYPSHQRDRRRWADLKAARRRPCRAAGLHRPDQALTQVG
jgi:hypothetical protein